MRKRIYDFYVTSPGFNGAGKGFAIGFDSLKAAHVFRDFFMFGFGRVIFDWQMEKHYPDWYYTHIKGA